MRKFAAIVCVVALAAIGLWLGSRDAQPVPQPDAMQREELAREWRRLVEQLSQTRAGKYDRILHYPER